MSRCMFRVVCAVGLIGQAALSVPAAAQQKSPPAGAQPEPTKLSAIDLAKAYGNPTEFDKKYKGKAVLVTGEVFGVQADPLDTKKSWVILQGYKGKDDLIPTVVRFLATKETEGLKKGDKVQVRGTVRPYDKQVWAAELTDPKLEK